MTIASLGLAVQSGQVVTGAADLDKLTASATRADAAAKRVSTSFAEAGTVMARINQMTGVNSAFGRDRAADIAAYGMELDRLRARFNPLFSAQQQFRTVTDEINRAQRLGAITANEAANAIRREEAAFRSATAAIRSNTMAANENRAAMGGRGVNAAHTTNLLFQGQDIAMMAASGQAAHILALQQGTQVAGIFHQIGNGRQVATALGGAIMGLLNPLSLATIAAIGLGTAGVQSMLSMSDSTDEASSALEMHRKWLDLILRGYEGVAEVASKAADQASRLPQASVEHELSGSAANQQQRFDEALSQIERMQASIRERIGTLSLAQGGVQGLVPIDDSYFNGLIALNEQLLSLEVNTNTSLAELNQLDTQLRQLRDSATDANVIDLANEMLELIAQAREAKGELQGVNAVLVDLAKNSRIQIEVTASTEQAVAAINELMRLRPELRSPEQQAADALAQGLGAPDAILRQSAQREYDLTIAALNEQERRREAEKASRAAASAGAKSNDAWGGTVEGFEQRIAQQQMEIELLGKSTYEIERQRAAFDLLNQAKQAGIPITGEVTDQINQMSAEYAAATVQLQRMTQVANDNAAIWNAAQDGVSGVLKTWARGGDILDTISNKLLNIGDMLIDMAVRDLFGAAFGGGMGGGGGGGGGGFFGWLGDLFGFANGGVFSAGHQVHAFASGGIVNRPTLFPMANGAGLMGEAGPEAIMPLRRGPNGKLGVINHANQSVGGRIHISLGWEQDGSGNIAPVIKKVANDTAVEVVAQAAPGIVNTSVSRANQSAPASMARYQQQVAGGDYRNG